MNLIFLRTFESGRFLDVDDKKGEKSFKELSWNRRVLALLHQLVVSTPLKNSSQIGNLPQIGMNIKNIWNHHPGGHYILKSIFIYIYVRMIAEYFTAPISPYQHILHTLRKPKALNTCTNWTCDFQQHVLLDWEVNLNNLITVGLLICSSMFGKRSWMHGNSIKKNNGNSKSKLAVSWIHQQIQDNKMTIPSPFQGSTSQAIPYNGGWKFASPSTNNWSVTTKPTVVPFFGGSTRGARKTSTKFSAPWWWNAYRCSLKPRRLATHLRFHQGFLGNPAVKFGVTTPSWERIHILPKKRHFWVDDVPFL